MPLSFLIGFGCALWVCSCGASLVAIRWSLPRAGGRFRAALIAACLALMTACLGLSHYHFSAYTTVNGRRHWSFDSKWLFWGALGLGAVSLALTFWNRWRARGGRVIAPR